MKVHAYVAGPQGMCLYLDSEESGVCGLNPMSHLPASYFDKSANVVPPEDTIPAVVAWDAYAAHVRQLIIDKSWGYGNAWQEQGYMGNLARVLSKATRLKNLLWKDDSVVVDEDEVHPQYESVMDTLNDLGPLAAFAVHNIEEGNRWGR